MLRKTVLLAVLALALPMAAFANSIDFANVRGTITGSAAAGLTISSTLIGVTGMSGGPFNGPNLGSVSLQTGMLTGGSLANGGTFGPGSIMITGNGSNGIPTGTLFTGSFTSATWTLMGPSNGANVYLLTAFLNNNTAFTVQTAVSTGKGFFSGFGDIESGDTFVVVPEPGTLGLLGTGLVGLAGVIRRRLNIS